MGFAILSTWLLEAGHQYVKSVQRREIFVVGWLAISRREMVAAARFGYWLSPETYRYFQFFFASWHEAAIVIGDSDEFAAVSLALPI